MKNKHYLLRKNTVFYNREFYLNYLNERCGGNELAFFENVLMFENMLHYLHGFMRREKKLTTREEVALYYIKLFGSEYRGDRIMHKYIDDLKLILSYYD